MTDESPTRTFVFETTHHAMWAEDVARDQAIPAEVVPARSGRRGSLRRRPADAGAPRRRTGPGA